MKKFMVFLLLCSMVWLWGCDGEKNGETGDGGSGTATMTRWQWGPEIDLSFEDTKGGAVVKDAKGKEILDVSGYDQVDIMFDELTGTFRCIKTYTKDGTTMIPGEGEEDEEVNLYKYSYYDTTGKLLEEDSNYSLLYIAGNMAYCKYDAIRTCLRDLTAGEVNKYDDYNTCYLTDKGFAVVVHNDEKSVFWSADGEKTNTIDGTIEPIDVEDIWLDNWLKSEKTLSQGKAYFYTEEPDFEDEAMDGEPSREDEMDAVVNNYELRPVSHFIFADPFVDKMNKNSPKGLVDATGKVLIEPTPVKTYSVMDDGSIVVYKEKTTEILSPETLKPVKTLDFGAVYYDGENAIKQNEEFYNYLTDGDGNVLSECYPHMGAIDSEVSDTEGKYFQAQNWNSWDVDVMDANGQILFTDHFEAGFHYLGQGKFYTTTSRAGKYIMDSNGKVLEMVRAWDGFKCNDQGVIEEVPRSY